MRRGFDVLSVSLLLSAAAGYAAAGESPGHVVCEIRTVPNSAGVTLKAVAESKHPATGEYEVETRKSGGGGTSSSVQSGDFQLTPEREAILSEVSLGGGGAIDAQLTLWSAAGEIICTAELVEEP